MKGGGGKSRGEEKARRQGKEKREGGVREGDTARLLICQNPSSLFQRVPQQKAS